MSFVYLKTKTSHISQNRLITGPSGMFIFLCVTTLTRYSIIVENGKRKLVKIPYIDYICVHLMVSRRLRVHLLTPTLSL